MPLKLWKEISKTVRASGLYASEAEFVREAVREKLQQYSIGEVRDIPETDLEKLVIDYITRHGKAYPSDISADLRAPYFIVLELMNRLVERGILERLAGEST